MAAGDAVQVGVEYLIGYGNTYYAGYTPTSANIAKTAETTQHKASNGATDSILTQDPGQTLDLVLDITGASSNFEPPDIDSIISAKGPDDSTAIGWRVTSASTAPSDKHAVLTLSLAREDSMASTYDTAIAG